MRTTRPFACGLAALAGLVLVWACSSDPPSQVDQAADASEDASSDVTSADAPADPARTLYASGTRLRAEVFVLDDVRLLDGFFDTTRAEGCGFSDTGAPGSGAHCTPPASPLGYLDAACSMPVAFRAPCDRAPRYAARYAYEESCRGARRRVQELRPVAAPLGSGEVWLVSASGECVLEGTFPLEAVGDPIPLTEFVHATTTTVDLSSHVAAEELVGEDSSRVVTETLIDRARDAGCDPSPLGPPSARDDRCLPSARGFSDDRRGPFADPACTEPAGYDVGRPGCSGADTTTGAVLATLDDGGACGERTLTFFERGEALPAGYRSSGVACQQGSDASYYRLGAVVDPSAFPALPLERFGGGRVRVSARSSEASRVAHGRLWDETERSECSLQPFTNGLSYCVPSDVAIITDASQARFRDAACTQEIVVVGCQPLKYALFADGAPCASSLVASIRPLGPAFDIAEYWMSTDGVCSGPQALDAGVAQDLLAPVDVATRFSTVERRRE